MDWVNYISAAALIAIFVAVLTNNQNYGKKIGRVYGRIDEHKDYSDTVYQSKEICDIHRTTLQEKMDKIDKTQDKISEKIDKILQKVNNGVV